MENKMTAVKPAFTDAYLKFTSQYFHSAVKEEEEPKLKIPEKVIRCIWNDQIFKDTGLATTDGETLEVLFPGYWNFGRGPDFKSAAIKVNDKLYEGDVELHVYGSDWKAHKHSENPDYDNVVLHVFMWKSRAKTKMAATGNTAKGMPLIAGAHIFELEVKNFLKKGILQLNDELEFNNYPVLNTFNLGLCHDPLSRLGTTKLEKLLNAAGDARILTKMERYHDKVIANGYEQTFYEGLAEALGYPINKEPFHTLAENLPVAVIKEILMAAPPGEDKALLSQAILFGAAGLIGFESADARSLAAHDRKYFKKIQGLWEQYKGYLHGPPLTARQWKFGGMRPANFPYRRIAGLARLIADHLARGIFDDFMQYLRSTILTPGDKGYNLPTRQSFNFFCVAGKEYWARHYTPGGKVLKNPQQLIGPDRSREITVNIGIPLGIIYARASKSVPLETAFGLLFQAEKKPTDNKWLRFMKHYLLGNNKEMVGLLNNDKRTQGMMQVYQDFCTKNKNNCLRCQFPGVVEKYFS